MAVIMPSAISGYQDGKIINNIMTEPIEQSNIIAQSKTLDMIDRMEFINDYGTQINAERITIEKGNRFDTDTAYNHVTEELRKLEEAGVLPVGWIDLEDTNKVDIYSELYINIEDISQNIIFWNIIFWGDMGRITTSILMDDESGKILVIAYEAGEPVFLEMDFEQMVDAFVNYLGLSIEEINAFQNKENEIAVYLMESGTTIYTADISDGSKRTNYSFGMQPYRIFFGLTCLDSMTDFIFSYTDYPPLSMEGMISEK